MPWKIPATVNGQQVEAEVAELPEPVVADIIKSRKLMSGEVFESELNRRTESVIKNKGLRSPDEMLEDATFVERISQKHGLQKGATSADVAQQIASRLESERQGWEDKVLNPAKQQLTDAQARVKKLTDSGLTKEVLRAAGLAGLKKQYLREPVPGRKPLVVGMFDGLFGYDEATDGYYVVNEKGDGFAFSSKPTKERPYMSAEEFITGWAEAKENADYVERTSQGGPGLGSRSGGADGTTQGTIVLTQEQANDYDTYQAALKQVGNDHSKIRVQLPNGSNPFGA